LRTCKKCLQDKEITAFKKHTHGYRHVCKKCQYNAEMSNPLLHQKRLDRNIKYRHSEQGKLSTKKYSQSIEGKTSRSEAVKKYEATDKGYLNKYNTVAKRRAARIQRIPKWLTKDDLWLIKEAYELAALRTKIFGFKWHVDHIIPLQGKTVSGLHMIENLQVIPEKHNLSKHNKFEVSL